MARHKKTYRIRVRAPANMGGGLHSITVMAHSPEAARQYLSKQSGIALSDMVRTSKA